jgi:3-deoxy-D-manno-octulosonic-acid transferase
VESAKGSLWFHVASVGEFNTAKPILKWLQKRYKIVLTYFSPRAKEYISKQEGYYHSLERLPLDLPTTIRSFERRIEPLAIMVMERELWPSLLLFTRSPKVWLNAYSRGGLRERLLSKRFELILTKGQKDRERLLSYGCRHVAVCGNLKFVLEEPPPTGLRLSPSKVILAGSTHPGEEELLRWVFTRLREEFKDLRLIVAPRHTARAMEVFQIFEGFRRSLRSKEEEDWDILVVDTLGELFSIYRHATVAFVGGTFVPVGGHNILEPAYFGKPVVYGPYTQKVEDMREFLEDANLGFQVKDGEELYRTLKALLKEKKSCISHNLKEYSERIMSCYLAHLEGFLERYNTKE